MAMRPRYGFFIVMIGWLVLAFPYPGTGQEQAPVYSTSMGIALEEYSYPYPVQFLTLNINGQQLRMTYMDVIPPNWDGHRAAVLLHGKNFYGSYWDNTIKALTAAGYRVIVPDQLGFGKSAKPAIDYSFDLLAANTAQLLDKLQVKQAVIGVHSMGGMLAVRFARNFPERTVRLVLEDPIGLEDYRFFVPPQRTEQLYEIEMNMLTFAKINVFPPEPEEF
jgi:pimeloyl-ACP methyl ester carboxylesterase